MRLHDAAMATLLRGRRLRLFLRVEVKNAAGAWVDYSNAFGGINWQREVRLTNGVDQRVMSGSVKLMREDARSGVSLAPTMGGSSANVGGYALAEGRAMRILQATMPANVEPGADDWREMVQGEIDDIDYGRKTPEIMLYYRDIGARVLDLTIKEERAYGSTDGTPLATVMQQMLDDNLGEGVVSLYSPTPVAFAVGPFKQDRKSLLEALNDLALQAGGLQVRYKYDAAGTFRLTLYDPQRTKTIADAGFGPGEYIDIPQLKRSRADVRNMVGVRYVDAAGAPQFKYVEDPDSIAAYGPRYMELGLDSTDQINTDAQATGLANAALHDCATPIANHDTELFLFWPVELGDLYAYQPNAVHYDAVNNFAVVNYEHVWTAPGKGRTTLQQRGTVVGSTREWVSRGDVGGRVDDVQPLALVNFTEGESSAEAVLHQWDASPVDHVDVYRVEQPENADTNPWPDYRDPDVIPTETIPPSDTAGRPFGYVSDRPEPEGMVAFVMFVPRDIAGNPGKVEHVRVDALSTDERNRPTVDLAAAVVDEITGLDVDLTVSVDDPRLLGGQLSVWVNHDGIASPDPATGPDGTRVIDATPALVTPLLAFVPGVPTSDVGTGGIITTSGGYTIHKFTGSGDFTLPAGVTVDVLIVGGGGGGGGASGTRSGGGGGGGGVRLLSGLALAAGTYAVVIGAGGGSQAAGSASSFAATVAAGGGAGGGSGGNGGPGASGGGARHGGFAGGAATPAGQGYPGGAGGYDSGSGSGIFTGSGGGGASEAGTAGTIGGGGKGGDGFPSAIDGSAQHYGGGGGGSIGTFGGQTAPAAGAGGAGGGGAGANGYGVATAGAAGTANTGGGGGGGAADAGGGAGGSGVVYVRYLTGGFGDTQPLHNVVVHASRGKRVAFEFVNTDGLSSGKRWFTIVGGGGVIDETGALKPGSIANAAAFSAGLKPVEVYPEPLPSRPDGTLALDTTDGRVYKRAGGAWVPLVGFPDLSGVIAAGQIPANIVQQSNFASGLRAIRILSALPGAGDVEGDTVYLTTDDKLYRWTGSAWTVAVPTADLSGTISAAQIAAGAVTAGKLAADAVTAGTIAAAAISARELASDSVTAAKISAGAIEAVHLSANSVTTAALAAGSVVTGSIAAGAVTTATIAAGAITATQLAVDAVTAGAIQAGAITASAIAAGAVTAVKISVSVLSDVAPGAGIITSGRLQSIDNTTYIDLNVSSGSSSSVFHHPNFDLKGNGDATFSGVVASDTFTTTEASFAGSANFYGTLAIYAGTVGADPDGSIRFYDYSSTLAGRMYASYDFFTYGIVIESAQGILLNSSIGVILDNILAIHSPSGTTVPMEVYAGTQEVFRLTVPSVAGLGLWMLYKQDDGTYAMRQVNPSAVDTAGSGFRMLRIAN